LRVFLDTNVLASAFVARGLCADLLRYLLAEHEILVGEVNLAELRRVLRDKFGATAAQIDAVETQLRELVVVPKPHRRSLVRIRDRADEIVLASALAGDADLLVSGDKDLLSIADRVAIPILSPRQAWEQLRRVAPGTA
jgi:putative PIN family toxin of toxin-antitoxin system